MKFLIYFFTFFIFFLTACEGFVGGSGVVKDQNGNPIPEAQLLLTIRRNTLDTIFYTDSTGQYMIREHVWCLTGCPSAEIKFLKKEYNSNIIKAFPPIHDTIIVLKKNL